MPTSILKTIAAASCMTFPLVAGGQTIIVDNADPGFIADTPNWTIGSATAGKYGADYRFANTTTGAPTETCRFIPAIPTTGYYYVSVWYNTGSNRASNTPYTVHGDLVTSTVRVNQQINGATFFYIGQAHFAAGSTGYISVANDADNLVVMADAVQLVYAGATPGPEPGGGGPGTGGPQSPELRGLWVSRFEWPRTTESSTKTQITNILNLMDSANFNSLFMQVRGAMETFYPSPNEPWAKETFNYTPQPYDPLAYTIQQAHNRNIKFHAYINTHVINQTSTSNPVPPPSNLNPPHPYFAHGNPADAAHTDWVYHTSPGTPQPLGAGEEGYNWAAPGVPEFQKWVRDQVVYVAQNYNVDGVHFDRIRFAGQGSYDPISLTRSASGNAANPAGLAFQAWNRDQITRLLNDIYGAVAEINYNRPPGKPLIEVSSAPFRGKSQQESVNQMLGDWTGIGAQDFFVPQVYTTSLSSFESTLNTNFPLANGRQVVAGLSRNLGGSSFTVIRDEILKARELGAAGSVVFSYTGFTSTDWTLFDDDLYRTKVDPPAMAWLTTPTQAIVVGNITAPGGAPIEDARITRTGSGYTWLSGADGFYSMLKQPAGQALNLTVIKAGYPNRPVTIPALAPGEVRRVNITLTGAGTDEWMMYEQPTFP